MSIDDLEYYTIFQKVMKNKFIIKFKFFFKYIFSKCQCSSWKGDGLKHRY